MKLLPKVRNAISIFNLMDLNTWLRKSSSIKKSNPFLSQGLKHSQIFKNYIWNIINLVLEQSKVQIGKKLIIRDGSLGLLRWFD
jgi:hypothetical protein